MKRLIFPFFFVLFAFSGCTTTGFLGFLATTDSVDAKMAEQDARSREELEMQRAQMDRMAKDLNELQVLKDNAEKAVDQAERSKQSVEELKGLIADLESRIGGLPEQTVRRIVEILQASLQEAEKADREKE